MINEAMFSSKTDAWETPQNFFDALDQEFHFTLDACALPENAKCENYFTPEIDGLKQAWRGVVWCNPPYGREIGKWVAKAAESAMGGGSSRNAITSPDRHKMVSQIHLPQSGDTIHSRPVEIRRRSQ